MPPLQLNDEEMNVLLALAGPIDQRLRPQVLQEVAAELEASGQAGGPGGVHRVGRVVQRKYWGPTRTAERGQGGAPRLRSRPGAHPLPARFFGLPGDTRSAATSATAQRWDSAKNP